jgi:hypothetical protein
VRGFGFRCLEVEQDQRQNHLQFVKTVVTDGKYKTGPSKSTDNEGFNYVPDLVEASEFDYLLFVDK